MPAGPDWQRAVRTDVVDAITAVELAVPDPEATAARWRELLGQPHFDNAEIRWSEGTGGLVAVDLAGSEGGHRSDHPPHLRSRLQVLINARCDPGPPDRPSDRGRSFLGRALLGPMAMRAGVGAVDREHAADGPVRPRRTRDLRRELFVGEFGQQ